MHFVLFLDCHRRLTGRLGKKSNDSDPVFRAGSLESPM
jgi:hypothetical protein